MRNIVGSLLIIMLAGCMVVDPSHFKYLDNEDLKFQPLLIIGAEQDVEISLPTNLATTFPDTLFVKSESLQLPYTKVLDFPYEWLWGGPTHDDQGLYLFELAFLSNPGAKLLEMSFSDRADAIRGRYENFDTGQWRDYVLKNLVIHEYQSQQGYRWIGENKPTVKQYHEQFNLPISDERQLVIWFWYNEDWVKDHPEWFESRKLLSRRILDTVKISDP